MQNKTAVRYYFTRICVRTQLVQSCATLCDPPGPSVHGISQARALQWVTVYSSRGSSRPRDWTMSPAGSLSCEPPGKTPHSTAHHIIRFSRVRLFATPWTMQSMGFSRPECWSGQPVPSPGDRPDPGITLGPPALQRILYQLSHQGSLLSRAL